LDGTQVVPGAEEKQNSNSLFLLFAGVFCC
jgi:hypothetical protein